MIPYSHQFIGEDDIRAVINVLRSDFLTQGPKVEEFETALADYCDVEYCVVFNSATTALYASCLALGLKKGDEFITTPISFVSTANAGVWCGAKPVFADIELETGNLNVDAVENLINDKVKLVIGVDYAGNPLRWDKLKELADKYGFGLIDDASHALGAKYRSKKIGSGDFADITVFSFHPVKPITTAEGGAALTNNKRIYKKLLMFRNHGITKDKGEFIFKSDGDWYYEMQFLALNGRMSDIQAALGISQLKKLDGFIEKRREIVSLYKNEFGDKGFFDFLNETEGAKSGYHLLAVLLGDEFVDKKGEIFKEFRKKGVGVQVHYIPIYKQPFYREILSDAPNCPNAEEFYKRELSLPVYPSLASEKINNLFNIIHEVFK